MIKLIIIDDEPEVRDLLNIFLRGYPGVQVAGLASNVDEAIQLTADINPDLVLLDIQMPGKDGFQYLEEINRMNFTPGIIFVTAYENYAIRAIRSAAFDYLLKPVKKRELYDALDRFSERNRNRHYDFTELMNVLNNSRPDKLKINSRTGYIFINPEEIVLVEAEGNYSNIKLISGKTEISTLNLGVLEKELDGGTFLRISRSFLINMKYVSRVDRRKNLCELEHDGKVHTVKVPQPKIKLLEDYFQ